MIVAHLLDMDGVLVRGGQPIAGSVDYVAGLVATGKPFQIFTNNSRFTPEDHAERLRAVGFSVQPEHIYTSALATARFVELQKPGSSAYVIGDHGLVEARADRGRRGASCSRRTDNRGSGGTAELAGCGDDRAKLAGIISSVCGTGMSREAGLAAEERMVDKYSLASKHPYGLNMIPAASRG